MPVVHQELGAVFLWRDRIIVDVLENLDILYIKLDAERRTLIRLYRTGNDYRRFLSDTLRLLKNFLVIALKDNALDDARCRPAIAETRVCRSNANCKASPSA